MITSYNYFDNDLTELNIQLHSEKTEFYLKNGPRVTDFKPKSLTEQYNYITRSFPYETIPSSDKIGITHYALEINDLIYEFFDGASSLPIETINRIKENRKSRVLTFDDRYVIYDLLENYFQSLIVYYNDFLKNAKELPFFTGIDNETIILKNLLYLYRSVLSNDSIQINVFWCFILTKKMSDKIISMLVDFIEQRLQVLNPDKIDFNNSFNINHIDQKIEKIKWLGTQQDLIELFVELSEKKWITDPEYQKRKLYVKSILSLFDIESTKRKQGSNPENSFYQKYKGEVEKGKRLFPFLEKEGYIRKFNKIKNNC